MHALIIEQDIWVIFMIEDALRDLGYTSFAIASSHEAAVAAARARCPDLITADIRLGGGSGLDAVGEICADRRVPVVFVTATPWEARQRDAAAIVVAKPFHDASLKAGIARATNGGQSP